MKEATFEPKSEYQKDDCIFPGCENESVIEAVVVFSRGISRVRCCEIEEHKNHAATLAGVSSSD